MRYALVAEGIVQNVVEWDGEEFDFGEGVTAVQSDTAEIGWTHDGDNFANPDQAAVDAAQRQALLDHLPSYRYQKEMGGITVGAIPIQTDRNTRVTLLNAAQRAALDPTFTISWKTPDGFVLLDAPSLTAACSAVFDHVQRCFDAEAAVVPTLDSLTSYAAIEAAFDNAYSGE